MQDRFDKELADRIKQVFDTYEDDSANHGWEELRKKFPEKKNRSTLIYWLTSAAAVLVLIAGAWLFTRQDVTSEKLALDPVHKEIRPDRKDSSSVEKAPEIEPQSGLLAKKDPGNTGTRSMTSTPASRIERDTVIRITPASPLPGSNTAGELIAHATTSTDKSAVKTSASDSTADKISPAAIEGRKNDSPVMAQNESPKPKISPGGGKPDSYVELEQEKRAIAKSENEKRERQKNKLSFSLFAGSFVSYAEGSKSSMNSGVGVTSEFGITSKLKITTGVSLAQNTLKYDKKLPEQAASMFLASSMSTSQDLMVAGPEAKTSAINYSINGYDASLLGLDVPINLKYTFVEKKNELYVVAGLSSNFFFDESYTYAYEYNSLIDNSFESSPDKTTTSTSSTFDFARMLNFSIGYGYPVGKQSKLSVEPFLKYPLGGMGAQNLRFGSAGLNLKWSFTSR